ncbi:MAG: hypothetical protein JNK14_13365 [Chitinophagaceae bacterium]|nr:hypothetical protein [Chitinophagaceae bacterium]
MLLSFLPVRVIVNDREIYPLLNDQPVVIEVKGDYAKVVVTDGFHFTKPVQLSFKEPSYYNFRVVAAINDMQLLTGFVLMAMLYLLGFFTGIFIIKLLSFLPVLYFLFLYYINRKEFIRMTRV